MTRSPRSRGRRSNSKRQGFTLLEVMLASSVSVSLVVGSVMTITQMLRSQQHYTRAAVDLNRDREALDKIEELLSSVSWASLSTIPLTAMTFSDFSAWMKRDLVYFQSRVSALATSTKAVGTSTVAQHLVFRRSVVGEGGIRIVDPASDQPPHSLFVVPGEKDRRFMDVVVFEGGRVRPIISNIVSLDIEVVEEHHLEIVMTLPTFLPDSTRGEDRVIRRVALVRLP